VGNLAFLLSLKHGGKASTVVPLTGMFPIVTAVLAMILLGDRLNWIQWAGFAVALAALFLFNQQPPEEATATERQKVVSRWMIYAIVALVLWGVAAVLQKVASRYISTELSTVCFAQAFIPVAIVIALIEPVNWRISGKAWVLALLFGGLIGVGGLVLFAAYRDGKASVVTALYASYPALTVILARPILGEKISGKTWLAIVLALIAAVALSYETPAVPA
jgi:drug/metabolite transporter (DMT)-like permease